MSSEQTSLFDIEKLDAEVVRETIVSVCKSLEERGYNPTNQIVGYLISGDPGYISSYNDARKNITAIDRSLILEFLLKKALKDQI